MVTTNLPQEPFWLGSFEVKLGSRSTIPTLIAPTTATNPYDENYTQKIHDSQYYNDYTQHGWSMSHSGTMVIISVFICTLFQLLPLTMWKSGWSSCLRCSSQTAQYVLTSSVLPTRLRRLFLTFFRFCLSPSTLSLSAGADVSPPATTGTSTLFVPGGSSNSNSSAPSTVPRHIAIIMDGNRRYGKEVHGDTGRGHADGGRTLSRVIDWCLEFGVEVLTVYAFSTENWNRDPKEIDLLMDIFVSQSDEILTEAKRRNVKVTVLSSKPEMLPTFVQQKFEQLERETMSGCGMTLNLCVSYGGRGDIVNACRSVASKFRKGEIQHMEDINEEMLSQEMLTGDCTVPDPDLLIRTSGERRLSNFLLWQVAYSELIFVEKHWPAFEREDMLMVLNEYHRRKRRFGK